MLHCPERVLSVTCSVLLLIIVAVPAEGNSGPRLPSTCLRAFTIGGSDCGTVTDVCTLAVNGQQLPIPDDNQYSCFRTCYEGGELGTCLARQQFCRGITTYVDNALITAMKVSSPNYGSLPNIGLYRNSAVCRFHIKCEGSKLLYYSFTGQQLQGQTTCSTIPGSHCVDRIKLTFPGLGDCERCGNIADPVNNNCVDRSGLGNEMIAEFVSNRQNEEPGFEMLVNCAVPGIDQNSALLNPLQGFSFDSVTSQQDCTSPDGDGPRNLPTPPPDESLQTVLDRDPNAVYRILEVSDALTYNNSFIFLNTAANGLEVFPNINSLSVESPFDFRQYFRIAPGSFAGYAQLVVSANEAFMVQFGVNPNLLPSEEEALAASLLDSAISAAVADVDQFDVLDELDELEQAQPVGTLTIDQLRSKRGVDDTFLDELALEYGIACNGVLRTTACVYQQVVLGRDCFTGQPI